MSGGRARSRRRRAVLGVVLVLILAVAVAAYMRLGWWQMDAVCSTDAAVPAGATSGSASYGWSWVPPGFTCTWGDVSVTKLWW